MLASVLPKFSFRIPRENKALPAMNLPTSINWSAGLSPSIPQAASSYFPCYSCSYANFGGFFTFVCQPSLKARLADEGVQNAWQLSQLDPAGVKRRYNVVLERTVRELRGESCLDLEEAEPDKQSICCSRMFGERITTLAAIKAAVATYVDRAAGKLRKQSSLAGHLQVGIQTSFHGEGAKYARSIVCALPYPSDDVRVLTASAMRGLEEIFRVGFKYSKAEVLLMDLRKRGEFTADLFSSEQPPAADSVMAVLDQINAKWGRGTLRPAAVAADPRWAMRRSLLSPSYLTDIVQLWKVKAI
jgi:DNA polymerase V